MIEIRSAHPLYIYYNDGRVLNLLSFISFIYDPLLYYSLMYSLLADVITFHWLTVKTPMDC